MPERIQRKRVKGWKMPPNTVYVGRPGRFGNPLPFPFEQAVYRRWLCTSSQRAKRVLDGLSDLRGKNLACWCAILDQQNNYVPCHADVLLSLANDIPIDEVIRENTRRAKGETL